MLKHTRSLCWILLMVMACPTRAASEDSSPPLRLDSELNASDDFRAPIDPNLTDTEGISLKLTTSLSAPPPKQSATPDVAPLTLPEESEALTWQSILHLSARALLSLLVVLLLVVAIRDALRLLRYLLRNNAASGLCIVDANWPEVSLLLCGHPPGSSLAISLNKLLATDYPREKIHVFPVFDPASSITRSAVDRYVALDAKHIHPLHLSDDEHTSFYALQLAIRRARGDIIIILDGPPPTARDWLKRCVAPFFSPAVGAIQSPTYPMRDDGSVLEHIQCLTRTATTTQHPLGLYRKLLPGAQLTGIRCSSVLAAGGLGEESLGAEVDLVKRLAERNWFTNYQELPSRHDEEVLHWLSQAERIQRDVSLTAKLLWHQLFGKNKRQEFRTGWPLNECVTPVLWIFTLLLSMTLYYVGDLLFASIGLAATAAMSFNLQQSPTSFLLVAAATRAQGRAPRISLLPLIAFSYLVGISLAVSALLGQVAKKLHWRRSHTASAQYGEETELAT